MANNLALTEFKLEDWMPMSPGKGPPLPQFLDIYWPWYKPEAAQFKLSNLSLPGEAQVGTPVTISCLVSNIGTEAGTKTIECKLEGEIMAEQTVTLNPAESRTISFTVTPQVAKTYSVEVDGLHGSFKAVEEAVADIRVENLSISPPEVMVGETVTISVAVINYGTKAGTKVITCTVS